MQEDQDARTASVAVIRSSPNLLYNGGDIFTYNGYANTNELQAQVTHTWGNGLTLQSYFTWASS